MFVSRTVNSRAELWQSGHSYVFSEMVLASNSQKTCQIAKQRRRATRQGRFRPCCQQSPTRPVYRKLQLKGHPSRVQVLRTQRTTDHQWKPVLRVKTHSCPACTKTPAFYRQHGFAMKQAFPHYESTCAESPTSTNTNASNRNVGRSTLRFRVCRKSHAYQYKRSKS